MVIRVEFEIIKTIEYTDGTPDKIVETGGMCDLSSIDNGKKMSISELIEWGQTYFDSDRERDSAIEDLLFLNRRDPKHKRSKYKQITFKVTDARLVEYPHKLDIPPTGVMSTPPNPMI
jgi:hypothetical protein